MKRVFLFLATNLAIIVVLGITLRILGVERILDDRGVNLDLQALLIFSFVFGMGGSFISLAISKWTAKRLTGAQVIEQPRSQTEQWLFETARAEGCTTDHDRFRPPIFLPLISSASASVAHGRRNFRIPVTASKRF